MGITSFASSSVKEISIGLLGESEMCSLNTLGEAPEDQGFHVHEVKWPMAASWKWLLWDWCVSLEFAG